MKDVLGFLKLIVILVIAGALLFFGYTFYRAYDEHRLFVPKPPPTVQELQIAAANAWVWFGVKVALMIALVLGIFLAVLRFLYVPAVNSRERIPYDPETGMLPLVRKNVAPMWKRITGHNEYDELDGNLAATPHRKVWSNGVLNVAANTHGLTPETQAEYARGSWGVQGSIARKGRGMTVGEGRFLSGEFHERAQLQREKALTMKDRRERSNDNTTPMLELSASVMPPISLLEAIEQSTERGWIIGQATDLQPVQGFKEVGKLLTFDPRTSHIAIIGGTGSGKTASTGLLMALYARRFGVHPIILDGKEGIDWGPLDGVVEWHSMSAETIEWQLDAVTRIFEKRWEYLKESGLPNIYKMPANKRPVPIFLMMEEFGDVWAELRNQDKTLYKNLGQKVDRLFRLSRATGITLCLIDQSPEKWSQQMRGNAKFVTCYKLKGGVANAFNEYHVDKLPNVGMFSQDNVFYKPWFTEEQADLTRMFAPLERRLLRERKRTEHVSVSVAETHRNALPPVVETSETPETAQYKEGGKKEKPTPIPPSLEKSFQRFRRWDEFCEGYFRFYPDTTQAQLRRVMSHLDGREQETFKTEAFRYYHRFSPNGDPQKAERT